MIYLELWKILLKWSREFTTHEFISTFSPPAPYKILHDMVNHGLLKKKGRSRYRAVPPEELAEAGTDVEAFYRMLRNANLKYALTAEDAVFLWTKGG